MFLSLQLSLGSPKVFSPSNLMEFWFLATVALLLACFWLAQLGLFSV